MDKLKKWIIPTIQAVISAVFVFMIAASGLLPGKYLMIVAAVVAVMLLFIVLLTLVKIGVIRTAGGILSIFICGMLIFGMVYVNHIVMTLKSVAGSDTEVKVIAVAVTNDNAANSIEDTKGYSFGVFEGAYGEEIEETIEEVKQLNTDDALISEKYDSLVGMAQALLDGEIDAVICNKAYFEIVDEVIVNFTSDIRIIYEKEFETSTDEVSDGTDDLSDGKEKKKRTSLTDEPYTVLVSGIDVSGPITTTSRSDVNILMTVNPQTHEILLTTTPRDYYVYLPGISGDMRDKLTHAGIYGVKTSMRTLENLYGITISDYIRINFDSLVQLVDALGGVDVYSEYEFKSGKHYFYKGVNHVNGEEALAFSRNRYAFGSGDIQRGQNQMLMLTAIINKLMSPSLLQNPSGVLDVVGKSMQTSIGSSEIADAIAWQLDTMGEWSINRQSVTGTGDSDQTFSMKGIDLYVMWPNEDSVSRAAEKIEAVMEKTEED